MFCSRVIGDASLGKNKVGGTVINRCGECHNCKQLEKVQRRVLAVVNIVPHPPLANEDQGTIDLWNTELARLPCIDSMAADELEAFLLPFAYHAFDYTDEWDHTEKGVTAQHALTRLLGLPHVSEEAPKDWAWKLVGDIGTGFSGIVRNPVEGMELVEGALKERGWSSA